MKKEIYVCTGEVNEGIYETAKIEIEDKKINNYSLQLKKGILFDIKI